MNGLPKLFDVDPDDEDTIPERQQESGIRALGGVAGFLAGVASELETAFADECAVFEGLLSRRSSW